MLKGHIVDIEYPQGLSSLIFVVEDFFGLFVHPCFFLIKRYNNSINNMWYCIGLHILIKF